MISDAIVQYIVTTSQVTDEMDNSNLSSTEAFQLDRRAVNKERTHYALFPCGTHEGLLRRSRRPGSRPTTPWASWRNGPTPR